MQDGFSTQLLIIKYDYEDPAKLFLMLYRIYDLFKITYFVAN